MQYKIVHESRLIQFFIQGSRLNKKISSRGPKKIILFLITIQEKENQFNSRFTRKKKSPSRVSHREYTGPSCQSMKQTASKFNLFYQIPDIPAFRSKQSSINLVSLQIQDILSSFLTSVR